MLTVIGNIIMIFLSNNINDNVDVDVKIMIIDAVKDQKDGTNDTVNYNDNTM